MASNRPPRGGGKKGSPRAVDASAAHPLSADEVIRQAIQPEGGVGGRSGNGQALPHRGFDDTAGREAVGQPVHAHAALPEPPTGPNYQTGGHGHDREQRVIERRQRESGVGGTMKQGPGLDSPPGAPLRRR